MYKAATREPLPNLAVSNRRAVSWRSLLIGTLGVALIAAVTPYNDFVINNTPLTASFFPPAITIAVLTLVAINTLIRRVSPTRAFSGGEMGVVLAMLLAGCAVPGMGMMRIVLPLPVTFFHQAQSSEDLWRVFSALGLPQWLFAPPDFMEGRSSSVVNDFFSRVLPGESIPWGAWVIPLIAWGSFFACVCVALLSLTPILRHQWAVNERLVFPLAQVGSMLIEPPSQGRFFNRLLSARSFWVSAGGVFLLHGLAAMHAYVPAFPAVSLTFDLTNTLTEEPLRDLSAFIKKSSIYFTFVGITYFIPARVGFSLWAIIIIEQAVQLSITSVGGEVPNGVWDDQHLGACAAVLAGVAWVGRRHWAGVLRQAAGARPAANEPSFGGWARLLLLAVIGMFAWLIVVGVGPAVSAAIVLVILSVHVLVARVVSETGLPFVRIMATVPQIAENLSPRLLTGREMFFAGCGTLFGALATRESVLPHALNGMQAGQQVGDPPPRPHALIAAIGWALGVAFVVSAVSTLWCQYTFAFPLGESTGSIENNQGAVVLPRNFVSTNIVDHAAGRYAEKPYSSAIQIGTGAAVTAVLQAGVLRFGWWPLVPSAYLVSHTWYVRMAWWSIFLGWLAKVIILRLGGSGLYQQMKCAFVGLVVGEAIAAGFWLLVTLVLVWFDLPYQVINLLPQ